jgi:hypothetical protein
MRILEQELKGKENVVNVFEDFKKVLQFSFEKPFLDVVLAQALSNIVNDSALYEYPVTARELLMHKLKDSRDDVSCLDSKAYANLFEDQFGEICTMVAAEKGITPVKALFELVRELIRVKENMEDKNGKVAEARFRATGIEV